MIQTDRGSTAILVALTLISLGLAGCSGPREDVRVSFCKALVKTQVAAPDSLRWTAVETHPRGRSGLSVVLGFEARDAPGTSRPRQASCHYRYDAVDDTALTLSDPLAAYATSPETMTLDGAPLARADLAESIKRAMIMQGRALIERAREGIEGAAGMARERLETGGGG
ncbi:MAG: hypothetical protein EOM91_09750 [Sphingobacteriia bacterium]|nr:hypothetical protein [Sphingobacteriia bacterium]NCC38084.1 hypothetical protein [Gammaproteobacteria bacterium]